MVDKLKELFDGFDLAKILPELDKLLGKVYPLLRFAMLIGPFCLLILGLAYFFLAPKEANRHFGYRCYFGMGSQYAWQFTQKLAGLVWAVLGAVLLVIMALISGRFGGLATDLAVSKAITCILWEIGLIALSCVGIDITVAVIYDRNGKQRRR